MNAFIFCTSFIKNHDAWVNRYKRWLDFYENVPIDAVKKVMIDDGSPFIPPSDVVRCVPAGDSLAACGESNLMVRFEQNLGRQSMCAYPGWWRSFLHSAVVAKSLGADKIIHVESDAFVVSRRLADFINEVESGWHVLWAQRYGLPETAIQVICRDQFETLAAFGANSPDYAFPDIAERILPFTSVNREFHGDRYSEFKRNRWIFRSRKFNWIPIFRHDFFWEPIPDDADFVTQGVSRQKIRFCDSGPRSSAMRAGERAARRVTEPAAADPVEISAE